MHARHSLGTHRPRAGQGRNHPRGHRAEVDPPPLTKSIGIRFFASAISVRPFPRCPPCPPLPTLSLHAYVLVSTCGCWDHGVRGVGIPITCPLHTGRVLIAPAHLHLPLLITILERQLEDPCSKILVFTATLELTIFLARIFRYLIPSVRCVRESMPLGSSADWRLSCPCPAI